VRPLRCCLAISVPCHSSGGAGWKDLLLRSLAWTISTGAREVWFSTCQHVSLEESGEHITAYHSHQQSSGNVSWSFESRECPRHSKTARVSEALAGSQEFFLERLGYGAEESAGVNSATWPSWNQKEILLKYVEIWYPQLLKVYSTGPLGGKLPRDLGSELEFVLLTIDLKYLFHSRFFQGKREKTHSGSTGFYIYPPKVVDGMKHVETIFFVSYLLLIHRIHMLHSASYGRQKGVTSFSGFHHLVLHVAPATWPMIFGAAQRCQNFFNGSTMINLLAVNRGLEAMWQMHTSGDAAMGGVTVSAAISCWSQHTLPRLAPSSLVCDQPGFVWSLFDPLLCQIQDPQ